MINKSAHLQINIYNDVRTIRLTIRYQVNNVTTVNVLKVQVYCCKLSTEIK